MKSAICTLFEGHYHYGVAALTNSLYIQGYRGEIYAGFRGELPAWARGIHKSANLDWPRSYTLEVAPDLLIHFLSLDTDYHLTNYKPDFLLKVWETFAYNADALYYFDPDIVVTTPWVLFKEWVTCGVALCEDVNSPLAMNHPTRLAWRRYFGSKSFNLRFKEHIYANGGFVGVSKENQSFLTMWKDLQEAMAPAIGGLSHSAFTGVEPLPFAPFGKTDQDAMNAAVEAWEGIISFVGKEGMAFNTSMPLMSHALGKSKPWLSHPLKQLIAGHPPRQADRDYWRSTSGPIKSQPASLIQRRKLSIALAAFLSRFYSRK